MGSSRVRPLTSLTGSAWLLSLNHVHSKFTLPNNWWFHWQFHQAPLQHLIKLLPCNILLSRMHLPKPVMIPVLVPPSITITPDFYFFSWWHSSSQVHPPKPLVFHWLFFQAPLQHLMKLFLCNVLNPKCILLQPSKDIKGQIRVKGQLFCSSGQRRKPGK